jgi:hypothetical protein
MLLRFRFSNVRSFKDEQELSMIAGSWKDLPEVVRHPSGVREGVLPLAAIYGANASGKTNVLRGLEFMKMAVRSSYRKWKPDGPVPREPFLGDDMSGGQPSEFAVDFLLGGTRYQYGFRLERRPFWKNGFMYIRKQRGRLGFTEGQACLLCSAPRCRAKTEPSRI